MIENGMRPIHPGEILREDYLIPLGLSVNALAKAALRLARYFGSDAQSWMNVQIAYDLSMAKQQTLFAIEREVLPRETAHAASSLDIR